MKLLLLILFPFSIQAQNKMDNAILIKKNIDAVRIKSVLFEKGFPLSGSDTNFFTTESKELRKWAASLKIGIAKTDSTVIIKGFLKGTFAEDFIQLPFRGANKSMFKDAWTEMEAVAKSLSPELIYLKQ